jgi:signal transduction histidine kinase
LKLFTKYNRINLLATIAIFLLASSAFYYLIRYVFIDQIDDYLKVEQREIQIYAEKYDRLPDPVPDRDQQIIYTVITDPFTKRYLKTLPMYNSLENKKEVYRQLIFCVRANGNWYKVIIAKSLEDTADLIRSILLITFSTILLILVASLIINRIVLKKLWKPFYDSLAAIKNFKIGRKQLVKFSPTRIDEFAFMNQTLEGTTRQAQHDYLLLKEFTENASHEMQTPLAIIRSKLDLLIQNENLSEHQSKTVQSAYNAIQKLSRLNHSLLLLAKIENRQFEETSRINLRQKIEEKLESFHELWQNEQISIFTALDDVSINMNNELTDILLNNLLSNATKHNYIGGNIRIELHGNHLQITNSSLQDRLDENRLYSRFYKRVESNENNGLGLSIIKQICDVSGFKVLYSYNDRHHSFTIEW